MKKLVLLLITIVATLSIVSCAMPESTKEKVFFETKVTEMIESKAKAMKLKDATEFDWDEAFVFTPYTSKETIYSILKLKKKVNIKTDIEDGEDINLIVFVKDGEVVKYFNVSRSVVDFKDRAAVRNPSATIIFESYDIYNTISFVETE